MSFLDNLENSLKSLESREERDGAEAQRREESRNYAQATAPWAERLKKSEYVHTLLDAATARAHQLRAKLYMAWLENTLRLEVKGSICEIFPTPDGIRSRYLRLHDGAEKIESVDLEQSPAGIVEHWLGE